MENSGAILVLGALAHGTRLETFQLLVRHEPNGLSAGEVARQLDVPPSTMSSYLSILARAGLVWSERHSRVVIYRADLERLREMMLFLVKECCGTRAELCALLVADLTGLSPTSLV